jgi:hypothetical protein
MRSISQPFIDSGRITAEHFLDWTNEQWLRLPDNGEWIGGLSQGALNRIADDPSTGVLFASLTGAPHKGVRVVGALSLINYLARCAAQQNPTVKFREDICQN